MHFHFVFSATEILWTLTFAAELVLLVVLLGRERARQFPWFTASIAAMAALEIVRQVLAGRLSQTAYAFTFLSLSDVVEVLGFLVLVEVARRAFVGASGRSWAIGAAATLAIAGGVLAAWGPWPAWQTLVERSQMGALRTMQMAADKGALFDSLLAVELGLLVVLLGERFSGGWRTPAQKIVIGLSTAGISQLVVRGIWARIVAHTVVRTHAQYDRLLALRDRLAHASSVVFICALVWWIGWMWGEDREQGNEGQKSEGQGSWDKEAGTGGLRG